MTTNEAAEITAAFVRLGSALTQPARDLADVVLATYGPVALADLEQRRDRQPPGRKRHRTERRIRSMRAAIQQGTATARSLSKP